MLGAIDKVKWKTGCKQINAFLKHTWEVPVKDCCVDAGQFTHVISKREWPESKSSHSQYSKAVFRQSALLNE